MNLIKDYLLNIGFIRLIVNKSKQLILPGFDGVPLFEVIQFFTKRISESELQTRARSLAFSFLLALFPAIIFIFTLIPYIPIPNFQDQLLLLISTFLPSNTYQVAQETIEDIVKHQRGGLLSFGFFFALFVSADGILALMKWFNKSFHGSINRSGWKMRIMAIGITIILSTFVVLAISLILTSEFIYQHLSSNAIFDSFLKIFLLQILKWIILLLLCFAAISLLYYYGPSSNNKTKFISAGSSLATLLIVITSLGFNYFITNFGTYNKVYGSIGTLIIILVWLFINSLVLLIGFELNVAIRKAVKNNNRLTPLSNQ